MDLTCGFMSGITYGLPTISYIHAICTTDGIKEMPAIFICYINSFPAGDNAGKNILSVEALHLEKVQPTVFNVHSPNH